MERGNIICMTKSSEIRVALDSGEVTKKYDNCYAVCDKKRNSMWFDTDPKLRSVSGDLPYLLQAAKIGSA